jgi:hypothetical protein
MIRRRREQVENAAADRELTTLSHHVDTAVRHLHQANQNRIEIDLGADAQRDRLDLAKTRRHRLNERAHRGHDHPKRRAVRGVVWSGESAQYLHPSPDGVRARRQSLVRQCFPRRELRDASTEHLGEF